MDPVRTHSGPQPFGIMNLYRPSQQTWFQSVVPVADTGVIVFSLSVILTHLKSNGFSEFHTLSVLLSTIELQVTFFVVGREPLPLHGTFGVTERLRTFSWQNSVSAYRFEGSHGLISSPVLGLMR